MDACTTIQYSYPSRSISSLLIDGGHLPRDVNLLVHTMGSMAWKLCALEQMDVDECRMVKPATPQLSTSRQPIKGTLFGGGSSFLPIHAEVPFRTSLSGRLSLVSSNIRIT